MKRAGTFVVRQGQKGDEGGWITYVQSLVMPGLWMIAAAGLAIMFKRWGDAKFQAILGGHDAGSAVSAAEMLAVGAAATTGPGVNLEAKFGTSTPVAADRVEPTPIVQVVTSTPAGSGAAHTELIRVKAHYSWYWPPLAKTEADPEGINCHGDCIFMASGLKWAEWIGRAVACPPEWPLGMIVSIGVQEWVCLDRGGAIVYGADGIPWIDFLTPWPLYEWGEELDVTLQVPVPN